MFFLNNILNNILNDILNNIEHRKLVSEDGKSHAYGKFMIVRSFPILHFSTCRKSGMTRVSTETTIKLSFRQVHNTHTLISRNWSISKNRSDHFSTWRKWGMTRVSGEWNNSLELSLTIFTPTWERMNVRGDFESCLRKTVIWFIRKSGKMRQMNETWLPCCCANRLQLSVIWFTALGAASDLIWVHWSQQSVWIHTQDKRQWQWQHALLVMAKHHFNLELKLSSWPHTCSDCSGFMFKNYTHLFPFPREYAVTDQSSWLLDATSTCSCKTNAKYNEKCTKY